MTLYEMTEGAKQLYNLLENEEIPLEAVQDTLEGMNVEGKLEDYVNVMYQFNADITMISGEQNRLAEKKKRVERGLERLKQRVIDYMNATNQDKVRAGIFNLSIRNSKAVNVTDMDKLSERFVRTTTSTEPDKTEIKKAIEAGEKVSGAELVINQSLSVK